MKTSERIKKTFEDSGKTYAELEKLIGISRSTLQRYANDITDKIPVDAIMEISNKLNVKLEYLLGFDEAVKNEDDLNNLIKLSTNIFNQMYSLDRIFSYFCYYINSNRNASIVDFINDVSTNLSLTLNNKMSKSDYFQHISQVFIHTNSVYLSDEEDYQIGKYLTSLSPKIDRDFYFESTSSLPPYENEYEFMNYVNELYPSIDYSEALLLLLFDMFGIIGLDYLDGTEPEKTYNINYTNGLISYINNTQKNLIDITISKARKKINITSIFFVTYGLHDNNTMNENIPNLTNIPVYNPISCGAGGFVEDDIIDYVMVPDEWLTKHKEYFGQRASGDSMTNANIQDGDILVFEKTGVVESGSIGCFCIDEDIATCKKFLINNDNEIYLMPANDNYTPIKIDVDNQHFRAIGKLVFVVSDRRNK